MRYLPQVEQKRDELTSDKQKHGDRDSVRAAILNEAIIVSSLIPELIAKFCSSQSPFFTLLILAGVLDP